jgi:hypothetical protein
MSAVHPETLLAVGYALFLVLAALGLDALARHSHRRSEHYRTLGFTYHENLDAWVCPEDERLHRVETDHHLRLVRYRARAHVCNACRLKDACTDSQQGREITKAIDPWPHSEAGRFHRGIAVVMAGLGALVIAAGAILHHGVADLATLAVALAMTAAAALYLLADFRESPSGFPWREEELSGPM